MEKRAVIEEGRTPPEKGGKPLEEHLTKRAAEAITEAMTLDYVKPFKVVTPEKK